MNSNSGNNFVITPLSWQFAAGRYCEWTHATIDRSNDIETFEEYVKTLKLECEDGDPAILNWTVAQDTPNLLYYQCYTHNNLGFKIHVVDPGQTSHRHNVSNGKNVTSVILLILMFGIVNYIKQEYA